MTAPRQQRTPLFRPLALAALGAAVAWGDAAAGELLEIYDRMDTASVAAASHYRVLAAKQAVTTSRLRFLPSLEFRGEELWVDQDIEQTEIEALRSGRESFSNTRYKLELDQPIFDATLPPQVRAARAHYEQFQIEHEAETGHASRMTVDAFLRAARLQGRLRSLDRVIARLEKEEANVAKMFEEKLATLAEVEIVKRNLVHAQRDHSILSQQLQRECAALGVESVGEGWGTLRENADFSAFDLAGGVPEEGVAERRLAMEIEELRQRESAVKRRGLPSLSLIGRYEFDDAEESLFGGAREITNYEMGVALKWEIMEGPLAISEAREIAYLKMAKQAELEAVRSRSGHAEQGAGPLNQQADLRLEHSRRLMEHQRSIMEAADRAYQGGTQSFVAALDAFLLYESSVRDWEEARIEQLSLRASQHARRHGWTRDAVALVDAQFE